MSRSHLLHFQPVGGTFRARQVLHHIMRLMQAPWHTQNITGAIGHGHSQAWQVDFFKPPPELLAQMPKTILGTLCRLGIESRALRVVY